MKHSHFSTSYYMYFLLYLRNNVKLLILLLLKLFQRLNYSSHILIIQIKPFSSYSLQAV